MIKIAVVDFDQIVFENWFIYFFGDGRQLNLPWLKKIVFYLFEIFEFLLGILGIKHKINKKTIDVLRLPGLRRYVLTDRSKLGLKNIKYVTEKLKLEKGFDFIQVRGENKNLNDVVPLPGINHCPVMKPNSICLYKVKRIAEKLNIEPHEIIVVDDNKQFRAVAKESGFRVFPGEDEFFGDADEFARLLGRRMKRGC